MVRFDPNTITVHLSRVIFTYEAHGSNTLTVRNQGVGGLDAMAGEFDNGHIEYGVSTVPCAATPAHPKVVMIHWVSERDSLQN